MARPLPTAAAPSRPQIAVTLGIGSAGLLITALSPILLGLLFHAGRLTAPEIGLVATAELLAMGLACGIAGAVLPAEGMRRIALLAGLAGLAFDLLSTGAAHLGLVAVRGGAGAAEGIMLWIAVAFIARQPLPERLAAIFLTGQVVSAWAVTAVCGALVAPKFGASGVFIAVGISAGLAALASRWAPDRLESAVDATELAPGLPPRRGWVALAAMFAFSAAGSAVFVYLDPIAHAARLDAGVVSLAVQASLAGQIAGGLLVTALAGKVRYPMIFLAVGAAVVSVYLVFLAGVPAAGFIACTAVTGFAGMVMTPFFVPMAVAADPLGRAAVMGSGAQILGGAGGPFVAALVSGQPTRVLLISIGWIALSVLAASWLAVTQRPGNWTSQQVN
jgi:hypothetical protein